ncbi:MAG: signal peptidase I [Pseudobdellovibrionaceae bacterium]|nr:signal peptidase I [Bdellovibrionales bacterium]USN49059.1 MAG: signal peptidase I [Pseudobdellovibrionaceae bacterium]
MGSFLGALLLLLGVRWALFEPFVIPSGSMIPTLLINDHIVISKYSYGLRIPFTKKWVLDFGGPGRGDVVVFHSVEQDDVFMIKRVVGLPGDQIEYDSSGKLFVNGEPVLQREMTREQLVGRGYYPATDGDLEGDPNGLQFFEEQLDESLHTTLLRPDGWHMTQPSVVVPNGQYFFMGDNRDNSRDSRYWGFVPKENLVGKALNVWLSCERTLPLVSFICDPLKLRWNRFFHPIK